MKRLAISVAILCGLGGCVGDDDVPFDASVTADDGAVLDATAAPLDATAVGMDAAPTSMDAAATRMDAAPVITDAAVDAGPLAMDADVGDALPVGDAGTSSIALTVSGTITGTVPAMGDVIVIWRVTTSEPNRIVAYGRGLSSGPSYLVTLTDVPPPEAINADGIAIGLTAFITPGSLPPTGVLMGIDFAAIAGLSSSHVVIYKTATASSAYPWSPLFPAGYSCGACVRIEDAPDEFAPADCGAVRLDVPASNNPDDLDLCNWI